MTAPTFFFFAAHSLVARVMASDNEVIPKAGVTNGDSTERDKRVMELLDDQDLRSLLIQCLEDGGHMVKKSTETNAEKPQGGPWQPFNGQFPFFPYPIPPYWGAPTTLPVAPPAPAYDSQQQPPVGSTSVVGQPLRGSTSVLGRTGFSSAQGQENGEDSSVEDKDTIQLLEEGESLELVQYDPTVKDNKRWDAGDTINKFLEKHFARTLDDDELDKIMEDLPKPDSPALRTPKLDEEVKRLLHHAGKGPLCGPDKALYLLALSIACGLTSSTTSLR